MSRPTPLPFTVLVHDLENYSSGGYQRHARLQNGQRDVMDEACHEADMHREQWIRQSTGDGELALLPAGIPKARIISHFIPELLTSIEEFNRDRSDDNRIRLRLAVDHGEVLVQEAGFPGNPTIGAARLCDSQVLKAALKRASKDLAVIVSGRFYEDVVRDGPPGVDPDLFSKVEVEVKTFSADAWIYVPGQPKPEGPDPAADTAAPDDGGGPGDGKHAARSTVNVDRLDNSGAMSFGGTANQVNLDATPRQGR